MVVTGILCIVFAVLLGILAIIAFVMFFVHWSEPARRGTWITIFAVSLIVSISLVIYTATQVMRKARQVGAVIAEQVKKDMKKGVQDVWHDDRSYLLEGDHSYPQIDLLQSYEPDSMKGRIDPEF